MNIVGKIIRKLCPRFIYKRVKLLRDRKLQDTYPLPDPAKGTLIMYFVPGNLQMTGGVMSIFNMCTVTRGLLPNAECILVTSPGKATYAENHKFPNEEKIHRITERLLEQASRFRVVYIHIPEYQVPLFNKELEEGMGRYFSSVQEFHINVMNQNMEQMPEVEEVAKLKRFTPHVTQTTAHEIYSTQAVSDRYGIPLHRFGTHVPASRFAPFLNEPKRKLILYSPDENPHRDAILKILREGLPEYRLKMVRGLQYMDWLKTAASAFATITFGEGMDGFYCEALCVKSLGIAVYNETFFPSAEWAGLRTIYHSYEEMKQKIVADFRRYEADSRLYEEIRVEAVNKLKTIGLSEEQYLDNLRRFYQGRFDFTPSQHA